MSGAEHPDVKSPGARALSWVPFAASLVGSVTVAPALGFGPVKCGNLSSGSCCSPDDKSELATFRYLFFFLIYHPGGQGRVDTLCSFVHELTANLNRALFHFP